MRQGNALKFGNDVLKFGGVCLKEFPACRDIEEQVLYAEIASGRACDRLLSYHLRTFYLYQCSGFVFFPSRLQFEFSNCGNGCKGLSPEPHRFYCKQVVGVLYL